MKTGDASPPNPASNGCDLVLLPGTDGTGLLFEPFLNVLPDDVAATVVAYPPDRALSLAELADVASAQIHPRARSVLVAESFSGLVAIELLRRNVPEIAAVVFVAAFLDPPRPLLLEAARLLPAPLLPRAPVPDRLLKRYLLGPEAPEQLVQLFRRAVGAVEPGVLADRLRMIGSERPEPARISVPVLYIQATDDRLVPAPCAAAFRSIAADVETARVGGPHLLLQAAPGQCWQAIRAFLRHRRTDSTAEEVPG